MFSYLDGLFDKEGEWGKNGVSWDTYCSLAESDWMCSVVLDDNGRGVSWVYIVGVWFWSSSFDDGEQELVSVEFSMDLYEKSEVLRISVTTQPT